MGNRDNRSHDDSNDIRIAFFLNLGFTVLELLGGLWTNSLAILSDAIHDLGDSISLGLAWFLDRYSQRDRDDHFSYGYRRFSLLGALLNTVVLLVGSLLVLSRAGPRLLNPQHSNAPGMIVFAIVGILVNGAAVLRLGDSESLNVRVVAWHLIEDVLGWVTVLIVAIVLLFADIHILDPVLSILITIYVLYNVMKNMREAVSLFLQAIPYDIDVAEIQAGIAAVEHVRSTHHTHVWSLDGQHHVLTTHVVVAETVPRDQVRRVKREIKQVLSPYEFSHLAIEIEYDKDDCAMA
jgi:cobalt-zinc-cadmium efflux system protein